MRDLRTDLAAVHFLEQRKNLSELHALVAPAGQATGKKLGVHVGLGQAEIVKLEDAGDRAMHQPQRIDIGDLVSAQTIDLNQPRDRRLLFARRRGATRSRSRSTCGAAAPIARLLQQLVTNNRMGNFGIRGTERRKVVSPGRGHRRRVLEVPFVQGLDSAGIAAKQGGRGVLFLQGVTHLIVRTARIFSPALPGCVQPCRKGR